MQAKRRYNSGRTARTWTAPRLKRRRRVFLCGLFCCAALLAACFRSCAAGRTKLLFPLDTSQWRLSAGYGWRADPVDGELRFHEGIDLACAEGTPVLAARDGVVTNARYSASYGNYLTLIHADGLETVYAHLQYLYVRPGEVVRAGQTVGTAGETGRATGPHLHFEVLRKSKHCDPASALDLPEADP